MKPVACWIALSASVSLSAAVGGGINAVAKWDLTYGSILDVNHIDRSTWLGTWLNTEKGPSVKQIMRRVTSRQVRSAVFLEYPAFHAGERLSWLFVRTTDGAYCWNFVQGKREDHDGTRLDPAAFDILVDKLLGWNQSPPLPQGTGTDSPPGGYFAFLSVRDTTQSRQILLNLHDFKVPLDPGWKDAKPGRVYESFDPVIELYD